MKLHIQHSCVTCGKLEQYTRRVPSDSTTKIGCPRCGQELTFMVPSYSITHEGYITLQGNSSFITFYAKVRVEKEDSL